MLGILISLLVIFLILIVNEYFWRKKKIKNELSRKTIHISVAVFVAFWPYYMSYFHISLIAVAFIVVILLSRKLRLFKSFNQVKRSTLGDVFFPIGILVLAIFQPAHTVFTVALLCVGLADGLAALIGIRFGKSNRYSIFSNTSKSLAGSSTVFVTCFLILVAVNFFGNMHLPLLSFIVMPLDVAIVEAFSVVGADDLLIPLTVLAILNYFK